MTRRNTELLLLRLAAPFVILLFSMVLVKQDTALSFETLAVPLGLFVGLHRRAYRHALLRQTLDPAIMPIVFGLSGIGIAFVTRLAPDLAIRQVMWLFLGIVLMVATLAIVRNLDKLAHYKYTFMILGIVLLLMPMLPGIGQEVLGSRIWLKIGGFSFQPGEIAKVCIVIFLASYLAQNREMLSVFTVRVGRFYLPDAATLGPLLVMWGISFSIAVFEKDLGSALVCFVLFLTMLYIASGKKMFLVVGFGLAALGCVILYAAFGHIQIRVNTWLDPFSDATNTGYQLCQSIYSLADGGMLGVGVGNGLAENIPVVESDFIFAAIAEETGLLGGAAVLLLFLCFAIRGFATAARAKSDVSSFVAVGVTVTIVLQAFIIVGGVTRPHPPDRPHASLHQSGRLLASGKLHRHRTAAALRRRGHGHQFRNERRHGTHARHRRTWRNARSERFERSGPRRPWPPYSRPPWWPSPCCSPCWLPTSPTSWCSWRTNTKATWQQPHAV